PRHDYVRHGTARNRLGNQLADQQPRNRGVAIRKMEEVLFGFFVRNGVAVHSLARLGIEVQAFKSRQVESPSILGRYRIDAHAKQAMRSGLIHTNDVLMHASYVSEETGITDAGKPGF